MLTSCSAHVLPRQWEVANVNGIEAVHCRFFESEMQVKPHRINWTYYVSPHENENRYNAEIRYVGNCVIEGETYTNLDLIGYPISAFRYQKKLYLLSIYPYGNAEKRDRHYHTVHLYGLDDAGFTEIIAAHTILGNWKPWGLAIERGGRVDWGRWAAVMKRLRFKDARLNAYAHCWYLSGISEVMQSLTYGLNRKSPPPAALDKLASEATNYVEREIQQCPQSFSTSTEQLAREGYFLNDNGEIENPLHPIYWEIMGNVEPTYAQRWIKCLKLLLLLGEQGKIELTEDGKKAHLRAMELWAH